MKEQTLAERAAWFHTPHLRSELIQRAHDDREAWQAYAAWHSQATDPAALTPRQCRDQIAALLAPTTDDTADQVAALVLGTLGVDRAEVYARRTRALAEGERA